MTRKKRLTRVVYGAYVVLVTLFVIASISQVARALFGGPESEAAAAEERFPKVGAECSALLSEQIGAMDDARRAASSERTGEAARTRYATERSAAARAPALSRTCSADPHGSAALAALARLDRAAESHAVRTASELSPVRLGAQSFIRGPR